MSVYDKNIETIYSFMNLESTEVCTQMCISIFDILKMCTTLSENQDLFQPIIKIDENTILISWSYKNEVNDSSVLFQLKYDKNDSDISSIKCNLSVELDEEKYTGSITYDNSKMIVDIVEVLIKKYVNKLFETSMEVN